MNVMLKKYGSYIFNAIFIIVLSAVTVYMIFKDEEMDTIFSYITLANPIYLIIGFLMMLTFVCSESVIINYLMNTFSCKVRFRTCIKYSFVGFFVSAITPSASGGQPAQLYYMKNDGIKISISSIVLMIITIVYKSVLLILGLFMFATEFSFVMQYMKGIEFILLFGIIINIFVVMFLFFVIFKQSFAKKVLVAPVVFLGRHRIIRNYCELSHNILKGIKKYESCADYLKTHKVVFLNTFVITVFQRLCLFFVTYLVYRSFGLSGTSAYQIVTLQTMIALSVDILPLPGGLGASESIFIILFSSIFTADYVLPGLLLSRGITHYALIILGAIVTAYAQFTMKRKKNTKSIGE
ncbi:MAG: flippase-like domain-containing protein [Lachnospiraceae bacterium]|nr:flippase-like domain-containing protein [Lachnospiraceae bacterium]